MTLSSGVAIAVIAWLLIKKQFFCDDEMEAKKLKKTAIGVGITAKIILAIGIIFEVVMGYFV